MKHCWINHQTTHLCLDVGPDLPPWAAHQQHCGVAGGNIQAHRCCPGHFSRRVLPVWRCQRHLPRPLTSVFRRVLSVCSAAFTLLRLSNWSCPSKIFISPFAMLCAPCGKRCVAAPVDHWLFFNELHMCVFKGQTMLSSCGAPHFPVIIIQLRACWLAAGGM